MVKSRAAPEFIGAALCDDVYDGPLIAAILRGKVVGNNLIFLNDRRIINEVARPADREVVVVRSVDRKVIRTGTISINGKRGAATVYVTKSRRYARNKLRQRIDTAAGCI